MSEQETPVERAMVVVAHPDDAEFGAGGTVARWVDEGIEVGYVIVTDGSKGSADRSMTAGRLSAQRAEEQRAAAAVLGVSYVDFLGVPDGEVVADIALRHAITREIRRRKPDIVVTHDPATFYLDHYINHPDHRAVGQATLDAIFPTARDFLNAPHLLKEGFEPHHVQEVWLTLTRAADHRVDIKDTVERKLEALRAHDSQFEDMERVLEWVRERGEELAKDHGMEVAEAFKRITFR